MVSVGRARFLELCAVFVDQIVENGIVVAEIEDLEANGHVLLLVEIRDAPVIVLELRVFEKLKTNKKQKREGVSETETDQNRSKEGEGTLVISCALEA